MSQDNGRRSGKFARDIILSDDGLDVFMAAMDELDRKAEKLEESIRQLAARAESIKRNIQTYEKISNKIKQSVTFEQDRNGIQTQLYTISQETRSGLSETVRTYTRFAKSVDGLGLSQGQFLDVTKGVNQAIRLSDASSEEAREAVNAFALSLVSGQVSAESFSKILENVPDLAQAISVGLDGRTPTEALALIEEGGLTAKDALSALQTQLVSLDRTFGTLDQTMSDAETLTRNSRIFFFGRAAEKSDDPDEFINQAAEKPESTLRDLETSKNFSTVQEINSEIEGAKERIRDLLDHITQTKRLINDSQSELVRRALEDVLEVRETALARANLDLENLTRLLQQRELLRRGSVGDPGTVDVSAGSPTIMFGGDDGAGTIIDAAAAAAVTSSRGGDDLSQQIMDSTPAIQEWAEQFRRGMSDISENSLPMFRDSMEQGCFGVLDEAGAKSAETLGEMGHLFDQVGGRAVGRLSDKITNLSLDMDGLKEIGRLALGDIQASFENLAQTGVSNLLDMLKQVVSQLFNVQSMGAQLPGGLGGIIPKIGGLGGGGFGLPFPSFSLFAAGGTLRSGQIGVVGEAGPEFALHRPFGTQIVPMRPNIGALSGRSGGAAPIIVNQSFDFRRADNGSVAQLRQESERIKRETVAEVAHLALQGGSYAKAIGKI